MAVNSFAHAGRTLGGMANISPTKSLSFASAMTIIVGTFASGGTQAPNWARFARGSGVAFRAGLIAFLIGNGLMLWFGAVGGNVYGEPDFAAVLKLQGLLGLGVVLMVLNVWTTNDNTAYAVGVAGSDFFRFNRKKPFILFCGLVGFLIAISGIYNHVQEWMTVMGIFIPPLGGVILGDYFLVWKKTPPPLEQVEFARFCPGAFVAYGLGVLAAYLSGGWEFSIPPLLGILVSALLHPVIHRLFLLAGGPRHRLRTAEEKK